MTKSMMGLIRKEPVPAATSLEESAMTKIANNDFHHLDDKLRAPLKMKPCTRYLSKNPFYKSEQSLVNSQLTSVQTLTDLPMYSVMQVAERNSAFMKNVKSIPITSQKVNNFAFWEMSSIAAFNRASKYVASKDPENSVWIDTLRQVSRKVDNSILKKAYSQRFKLNGLETESIIAWTYYNTIVFNKQLLTALQKISPFRGIVVRNTNLDSHSLEELLKAYTTQEPLMMRSLIQRTSLIPGAAEQDFVLATTAAGNRLYNKFVHSSRLVIYSKQGRLVAPLSRYPDEMEIIFHSGLSSKGFQVTGRGTTKADLGNEIDVWFMQEIA